MSVHPRRSHHRHLDVHVGDIEQRIRNGTRELIADGEEAIENLGNKLRDQVCDRPLTSLVVASSVGLLLGLLVSRKR